MRPKHTVLRTFQISLKQTHAEELRQFPVSLYSNANIFVIIIANFERIDVRFALFCAVVADMMRWNVHETLASLSYGVRLHLMHDDRLQQQAEWDEDFHFELNVESFKFH